MKTPLYIAKDVYEILRDTLTESRMGTPIYYAHFDGRQVIQIHHDACVEVCRDYYRDLGVSGDQAGHLIPKRLGGYNKRANLAPQNGTLNQGKWRSQLEAGVAECHSKRNNGLFRVTVRRFFGLITTTELGTLNSATYTAIANYGNGGRPIGYTPTIVSSFTVPSGQAGLDTIITVPNTAFANTSNTLGQMKSIIVDKHCKQ